MSAVEKTCEICSRAFSVRPYRATTARFCSRSCSSSWTCSQHLAHVPKPWAAKNGFQRGHKRGHAFPKGHKPWNHGLRGLRVSPRTEFKPGQRPKSACAVGTERIRRDKVTGAPRVFVKTAEPNVWRPRAVLVWESQRGPVPAGHVVHHENRDTTDDAIDNLACVTRAAHLAEHRGEHVHVYATGDDHHARRKPECLARGERARKSSLTAANVVEIRELASALSRGALARRFGVTKRAIQHIVNRRTWRHVP